MPRWKLTLAYNGTAFHGWQVQPHLPTVQGSLAAALARLTGEQVLPQGSGRTDAGVHALGQVASFDLQAPIPPENLRRALNRALPVSIRVLTAEIAEENFHARHSAVSKTYEFRIFERRRSAEQEDKRVPQVSILRPGSLWQHESSKETRNSAASRIMDPGWNDPLHDRICPPMLAPYVWDCPFLISWERAQHAATAILGEHDFSSFAASDPDLTQRSNSDPISCVRTILQSGWTRESGLLVFRVTGSGFLHHMVRNLVGTFVEIARGRFGPNAIPSILAARDRAAAGPTAPASGLFLHSVQYPRISPDHPSPAPLAAEAIA